MLRLSVKMAPLRPDARNPADGDLIVEIPGYGIRRIPHHCPGRDATAPVVEVVGRICPPRPGAGGGSGAMFQVEFVRYADDSPSAYLGNCFFLEGPEQIEVVS